MSDLKSLFFGFILYLNVLKAENLKIASNLESTLQEKGQADIFITLKDDVLKVLDNPNTRNIPDPTMRISVLVDNLEIYANNSQKNVREFLTKEKIFFKSFWISNQIYVKSASEGLVNKISQFEEIVKIDLEIITKIPEYNQIQTNVTNKKIKLNNDYMEWNLERVGTREAWKLSTGKGIKIGIIDTGVRGTHKSLMNQYVGNSQNGWFDPIYDTKIPTDNNGHGSHCAGTALGQFGIGIAKDSKWLGCTSCNENGQCFQNHNLACAQFMMCPTDVNGNNRDCSKKADIVSNSWGGLDGGSYFNTAIDAWIASGIIPVFANMNMGSGCSTVGYPASNPKVISVGSTGIRDLISQFSSRGPTLAGIIKPDISAPGEQIYSASHRNDDDLVALQGTSMATPLVSGTIALLLSKYNIRNVEDIKKHLALTARKDLTNEQKCGNDETSKYPNNVFGHGRLDASKALKTDMKKSGVDAFTISKLSILFSLFFILIH